MRSGELRHIIVIQHQQETITNAATGARGLGWVTFVDDVPAAMVPASGREFRAADATQAETLTRCKIRELPGVTAKMRVVHEGRNYNIRAILPDPKFKRHINLMLAEGVNDGR